MNKYETIYNNFIESRLNRGPIEGYVERHHILPRSLGGSDENNNMIALTAREHFFAHRLLAKYAGHKMIRAFSMMCHNGKYVVTSREFETAKIEFSKIQSERMSGKNNPMYGKMTGKDNHMHGRTGALNHNFGKQMSETAKQTLREAAVKRTGSKSGRFRDAMIGVCLKTGNTIRFEGNKQLKEAGFNQQCVNEVANKITRWSKDLRMETGGFWMSRKHHKQHTWYWESDYNQL